MKASIRLATQKTFQIFSVFVFAFLTITETHAAPARKTRNEFVNNQIQNCLNQALRKETANARDAAKLLCLNTFAPYLSVDQCLSVARGMAYFSTSNQAKLICGSDLREITAQKCLEISREITYSETADELKWTCLTKFKKSIPTKQCIETAKEMSLLPLQNKALEFCSL